MMARLALVGLVASGSGACRSASGGDGGAGGSARSVAASGSTTSSTACADPSLVWRTANKTTYESYPDPGSPECVQFNGCAYVGQFSACANTMPEAWVASHRIAAVFPLGDLALHRICVRAGDATLEVVVLDTCADSDCSGCCTENRGTADALIDLEKYTDQAFGKEDGPVEWADLGSVDPSFDGCN